MITLDEVVLTGAPSIRPSTYLQQDAKRARQFTLAMHNYARLRGKELGQFLDTGMCNTLLDVGCGPGTYAFHLGLKNPMLQLYLLDWPRVLEVARDIQQIYPLKNRVHYIAMDAIEEEIPGSYPR